MEIKTISVLGCGWFGLPLASAFVKQGYKVKGSTTSTDKMETLESNGIEAFTLQFDAISSHYDPGFFDSDLLVISIPPRSKSPDSKGYPSKIQSIMDAAAESRIRQVIFISSTGVFEDGNFKVNENDIPHPSSEAGNIILKAETILRSSDSFTTTVIRFAGLTGPDRNLAKHFAGKMDIPNGLAPINLIHLEDCIGITLAIVKQSAFGMTYHGVTPDHPNRADFYSQACMMAGFEKPRFLEELVAWKQIDSINVPQILNYEFTVQNWMDYEHH